MKLILKLLCICLLFFSCKGQNSKSISTIEPKSFLEYLEANPNPQLIDVRTPEEFESSHIDKAVNIDWLNENFSNQLSQLDKQKPIFVYCKSGGRSQNAANKLDELGFKIIYNLEGGILRWEADGYSKPKLKNIGLSIQEFEKLLLSEKKVLINFYAPWCAPCKKMAPYLIRMQKEESLNLNILRFNADEETNLIQELNIDALPTLLLYENKALKWRFSGYISEEDLKHKLQ